MIVPCSIQFLASPNALSTWSTSVDNAHNDPDEDPPWTEKGNDTVEKMIRTIFLDNSSVNSLQG